MTQPVLNGSVFSGAIAAATGTVATFSGFTVGSLSNGCAVFGVVSPTGSAQSFSSVTWNGTATTAVASTFRESDNGDGTHYCVEWYRLVAPAAGSFNIVVNCSVSGQDVGVFAASFDNVNQSTPVVNGANAGQLTPNATPSQAITNDANSVAIGLCGAYDTSNNLARSGGTALGTKLHESGFTTDSFVAQYSSSTNPTLSWTVTTIGTGGTNLSGFSLQGTSAAGQVNQRNGIALSGISAINGITKSGLSAVNGLTI